MNNKVFSNLDVDPRDTLGLAETESTLWTEAQGLKMQRVVPYTGAKTLPLIYRPVVFFRWLLERE